MKHLKTYNEINEGIFSNLFSKQKYFLVKYEVINRKCLYLDKEEARRPENFRATSANEIELSKWTSPVYTHIIKADSKEKAKSSFIDEWNNVTFHPSPSLKILSVKEIDKNKVPSNWKDEELHYH